MVNTVHEKVEESFFTSVENFLYWNHDSVRSYDFLNENKTIDHIFSSGTINFKELDKVFIKFKNCKVWNFSTKLIKGVYVENDDENFLIFNPHDKKELIDEFHLNQSMDKKLSDGFENAAKQLRIKRISSIDYATFEALIDTYTFSLGDLFDLEFEKVNKIKALNSQKLLIHYHKELLNNKLFERNSHLDFFSYIYFCELYIISKLFEKEKTVWLHDVATNTAQLPILLSTLNMEECFGINYEKIECSDVDMRTPKVNIENCIENGLVDSGKIDLSFVDLVKGDPILNNADVIIANDVLEHFNEDLSYSIFHKLWSHTKNVLIIHVPTEKVLSTCYGHLTLFNYTKLKKWVGTIENCEDLSDNFPELDKHGGKTSAGFLVLKKIY